MNPAKYDSIFDMMMAFKFVVEGGFYVLGDVRIPIEAAEKHTTSSFFEKMKRMGWLQADGTPLVELRHGWGTSIVLTDEGCPWLIQNGGIAADKIADLAITKITKIRAIDAYGRVGEWSAVPSEDES